MRRLFRALVAYFTPGCCLTWRTCWRHAKEAPRFHIATRDGFRYVEPRADASRRGAEIQPSRPWPRVAPPGPRIVVEGRVPQDVQ